MKRSLSGIKPTGNLTLGNYIGALKNFKKFQDDYENFIFIADLSTISEIIEWKSVILVTGFLYEQEVKIVLKSIETKKSFNTLNILNVIRLFLFNYFYSSHWRAIPK